VRAHRHWLDLDNGMAIVIREGNKARPIYFSGRTTRAVDRYLRMRRRHRWSSLTALFLTQRGALTPDGARERMKRRDALARIDESSTNDSQTWNGSNSRGRHPTRRSGAKPAADSYGWTTTSTIERTSSSSPATATTPSTAYCPSPPSPRRSPKAARHRLLAGEMVTARSDIATYERW
jgi:integrase